jgi:hypothetical protein
MAVILQDCFVVQVLDIYIHIEIFVYKTSTFSKPYFAITALK